MEKNDSLKKSRAKLLPLLLFCACFLFNLTNAGAQNMQQNIKVSGTVVDAGDQPVIGASVVVKGAATGDVTDINGKFSFNAPSNATLRISYIGYLTQEVAVNGKNSIKVILAEDAKALEEIVVVGFGTQKKVNLTGAVGTVTTRDLEERPVQNVTQALQGTVAGLNISTQGIGGTLNAGRSVNVRGIGTIGSGSSGDPLILVDGMEGSLDALNPQDIESISVLKDAAASSIYGSRAPFGVVLVTTKKGREGRTQINYNNSFRYSKPVMVPDMMDSYQFFNYWNDAFTNGGGSPKWSQEMLQLSKDYIDGKLNPNDVVKQRSDGKWDYDNTYGNIDWMQQYYREVAPSQEHNVSINGGNENWKFYFSANLLDQEGLMRYGTDTYNRYTVTGKISGKVTDYLTMDYTSRFVRTDYQRATSMTDGFYDHIMRRARPNRPVTDPNGYYMADVNYVNALLNGGRRSEQQDNTTQQLRLTLTPVKNWNIIGEMNYRTNNNFTHEVGLKTYAYYADGLRTYLSSTTSPTSDYVYEYALKGDFFNPNVYTEYTKEIGKHNFKFMGGYQAELYKYRDMDMTRNDLISTSVPVINKTTNAKATINGQYQHWATEGFFGRINYDFAGKYLAEVNLRYDGTSRFREEKQWNLFPSFSLGWNIANEEFFEPLKNTFEVLKLRGSYGMLGNQNTTGWYPTYQTIPTGTANGTWLVGGAQPNTASAPALISSNLTWETIRTYNVALDFGLLNNRLTGSFDAFNRFTDNMVGPAPTLPVTLGTAVPRTNNTNLKTYGFELSIGWRDRIGEFSYGAKLNLSDSQTKILKYPNETGSIGTDGSGLVASYLQGYLTGEIWGYETIGIAKSKEEMDAHLATLPNGGQTALGSKWEAGDIMYKDLNGDQKISGGSNTTNDPGDRKVIGNATPRFATGIDLDASYKGFDVRAFFQGILKRDYFPSGMVFWGTTSSGEWWSTCLVDHLDYYRGSADHVLGQNLDSYYPRPVFGNKNQQPQTKYLQNAAYMRLKNLQLGYTLPSELTKKAMIQKLRVFVSGENLLTFTKLTKTLDPESVGIGRQGGTVYPLSTVYSFGLSVNF
jgi:TonB-linked SusC/RagA family outer membrane protein